MSQNVYIKSGEETRAFAFGPAQNMNLSPLANANSLPMYKESVFSTFQAYIKGTGAITGTCTFYGSNHNGTGRGIIITGKGRGVTANTTNGSPTLQANGVNFTQNLVGGEIRMLNVPAGTTVSAVAANGLSLTMSGNATATAMNEVMFFDNLWCATVLATITLSGSGNQSDGFTTQAPWRFVQARWTNLTGTLTETGVLMGV